jgi:hypothetical protein
MTTPSFRISPWTSEQTASLEAWGHDRRAALQAGLDGAVALMLGEAGPQPPAPGPVAPLRGEGDTVAALFDDLLDDLVEQMAVHGPIQVAALDGVLKRDREGFVAWGYVSPRAQPAPVAAFERVGSAEAVETPEEIRLRITLRRLG